MPTSDKIPDPALTIRKATHDDYEAILAMGDMYQGRDYMKALYHDFIDDPSTHALVAEMDQTIVGLRMVQLLDGGETAFLRGGRVKKEYRKRGIYHTLENALVSYVKTLSTPPKIFAFGTTNLTDKICNFAEEGYREVLRKECRHFYYNTGQFKNTIIENSEGKGNIVNLSKMAVLNLIETPRLVDKYFSERRFCFCYTSYKIQEQNIDSLINHSTLWFASSAVRTLDKNGNDDSRSGPACPHSITSARMPSQDFLDNIDTISCSRHYLTESGLFYDVAFYSTPDVPQLDLHLRSHLLAIVDLAHDRGIFCFSVNPGTDPEKVISCLKDHGIEEMMQGIESQGVWYEKPI